MAFTRDSAAIGTALCVLSAVAYTAYNVCLREVSERHDAAWINCVQASVSVVAIGVWLIGRAMNGRRTLPSRMQLLALAVIGVITQLGGVLFVWGMGIVGVAVTATLQTGGMLAISAVLGFVVLGERVTRRQILAIFLITASVVLLSMGANATEGAAAGRTSPTMILLGIAAGALAGFSFAVLTVGVRKAVTSDTSPVTVVFMVNLMGVVVLGPWCMHQPGLDALLQTAPRDLAVMLAAGALNLIAFLLVTRSLQSISVVLFNVLNNGLTAALTAVMGIALLSEPYNGTLLLGILLSTAGIIVISLVAPDPQPEQEPSHIL